MKKNVFFSSRAPVPPCVGLSACRPVGLSACRPCHWTPGHVLGPLGPLGSLGPIGGPIGPPWGPLGPVDSIWVATLGRPHPHTAHTPNGPPFARGACFVFTTMGLSPSLVQKHKRKGRVRPSSRRAVNPVVTTECFLETVSMHRGAVKHNKRCTHSPAPCRGAPSRPRLSLGWRLPRPEATTAGSCVCGRGNKAGSCGASDESNGGGGGGGVACFFKLYCCCRN